MCLIRCLKKNNLCSLLSSLLLIYVVVIAFNVILFVPSCNKVDNFIYITEDHRMHYVNAVFYISIIFMLMFVIIIINTVENAEYNLIQISRLLRVKRFLEEENDFLKKRIELPSHIKKIVIDYFIKKENCLCSICLSDMETNSETFLTFCGHLYHKECIDKSLEHSNKCPYCRTNIDYRGLNFT